jgi:NHL repeat
MKHFKISALFVLVVLLYCPACKNSTNEAATNWVFDKKIALDSFGIVGIAPAESGNIWLSDADNQRLIKINTEGKVLDVQDGYDRPMHIAEEKGVVLVAEYGSDRIRAVQQGKSDTLAFPETFDAPSGVDVEGDKIAVADFYNHRIVFTDGITNLTFGKKGNAAGELTYPTDVQFAHDKLWVADAYNHRVQVFDLMGKHLKTFGEAEKMNAMTGLFVGDAQVFATDFENSRIVIYDLDGNLKQVISDNLDKPSDVLNIGDQLFVVNYNGRFVSVFKI